MNKSNLLLTICIPTYKRPQFLKLCILSIIKQTSYDKTCIEVLISDNDPKSTNNVYIRSLQKKGFQYLHYNKNKKNIGLERNFIKLIKKARGKYIFFLTDDDELLSGALQKITTVLNKHPTLALFSCSLSVFKDKILTRRTRVFEHDTLIHQHNQKDVAKIFYNSHTLSGNCVRRNLVSITECEKHLGSLYPQMYFVGHAALNGPSFYFASPLIRHVIGNPMYWKYKDDYMLSDILKIIRAVSHETKHQEFQRQAESIAIGNIPYILFINIGHPKKLLLFVSRLFSDPIFHEFRYLSYFFIGIFTLLLNKLRDITDYKR